MSEPEVRREGDTWTYLWHDRAIGIGLSHVTESSDGIHAEITIQGRRETGKLGHIHWAKLNLASTRTRQQLSEFLARRTRTNSNDLTWETWYGLIEYASVRTIQEFREGLPFVDLSTRPRVQSVEFLLERLLPLGQTTAIWGHGGRGKGWLATAIAISVLTGKPLPCGLRPKRTGPVIYLDWETSEDEINRRLYMLSEGMGLSSPPPLIYREMHRPLVDEADRIRAEIARRKAVLVIVDSLIPAVAGDYGSDAGTRAMNALRSFAPASRLVLAHMTKASKESTAPGSIIGTVMFENLLRSGWELRSQGSPDAIEMALFHRKVNAGREQPPFGLRFLFAPDDSWAEVEAHDITDSPELAAHASLALRILAALRDGRKTVDALAEELEEKKASIRTTLHRLKKDGKVIQFTESRGSGAGLWGRATQHSA